jgi:hypothetical protein
MVQEAQARIEGSSSIPQAFKIEVVVSLKGEADLTDVCGSPLCTVRFEQTGTAMQPRRFCSDTCRQDAWIIKRAAALLEGLNDERVLEILRDAK